MLYCKKCKKVFTISTCKYITLKKRDEVISEYKICPDCLCLLREFKHRTNN